MRNETVINSSLISKNDLRRVQQWIEEAVTFGAQVLLGGKILVEHANLCVLTVLTNTI